MQDDEKVESAPFVHQTVTEIFERKFIPIDLVKAGDVIRDLEHDHERQNDAITELLTQALKAIAEGKVAGSVERFADVALEQATLT